MENLVATLEQCRKLQKKYPEQKGSFNWYVFSGISVGGNQVNIGESINYKVGEKTMWQIGLNLFSMSFVREIVPAYSLQDIIELYDGNERVKNVKQIAELLTDKND